MKTREIHSLFMMVLLLASAFLVSCGDDEPTEPEVLLPNLDGLYVYGTNTVAAEPGGNAASKVNLAVLDPGQGAQVENMDGVFGKFIHIGANSTISLAHIENENGTVYGVPGGGTYDSASFVGGVINDRVISGTLEADADPINVTNEGLYYLYVDINNLSVILMEIKADMIGDATINNWSAGTGLSLKSSDTESTVFEGTDVTLYGAAGYRYRFNDGWHVYADENVVTLSSLGVPSYGEAWDSGVNDVGYHLDNIPNKESGLYTVTLTFTASTGEWEEVKTKTGDLLVDYSSNEYGIFGNAYFVEGNTEGAWDAIHHVKTPEKDGNIYNWIWTLELIEGRSFVFRESPDGEWVTFGGAAKVGTAFDNEDIIQEDGQDNYFVSTAGTYDITFTINAEDEGRTLTIEPHQ